MKANDIIKAIKSHSPGKDCSCLATYGGECSCQCTDWRTPLEVARELILANDRLAVDEIREILALA